MTLEITSDLCMQLLRWQRFINTENTTKVSLFFCVRLQLFLQWFFGHLFALLWNVAAAAAADLVAGLARKSKQLGKNTRFTRALQWFIVCEIHDTKSVCLHCSADAAAAAAVAATHAARTSDMTTKVYDYDSFTPLLCIFARRLSFVSFFSISLCWSLRFFFFINHSRFALPCLERKVKFISIKVKVFLLFIRTRTTDIQMLNEFGDRIDCCQIERERETDLERLQGL